MANTKRIFVLDLNDHNLCLQSEDMQVYAPGYAIFDDHEITTGKDAKNQYRLKPLSASNQFWDQLSLDPIRSSTARVKHNADLVYHQLKTWFDEFSVEHLIISAPGSYSERQLALLLGICQSLNVQVDSIVDSAVLHTTQLYNGQYVHVEFLLHQAVLTPIDIHQRTVLKKQATLLPGCGAAQIDDAWARAISDEFIRQLRYNPLHDAKAEQSVYNQLAEWQLSLAAGNNEIRIDEQSIKIANSLFSDAIKPLLNRVIDRIKPLTDTNSQIVLSPSCSAIVGLNEILPEAILLSENTTRPLAFEYLEQLQDDHGETALIHQLRANPARSVTFNDLNYSGSNQSQASALLELTPSHLLVNSQAYPIGKRLLLDARLLPLDSHNQALDAFVELFSEAGVVYLNILQHGLKMNDREIDFNSTVNALKIGDKIASASANATLIKVHS